MDAPIGRIGHRAGLKGVSAAAAGAPGPRVAARRAGTRPAAWKPVSQVVGSLRAAGPASRPPGARRCFEPVPGPRPLARRAPPVLRARGRTPTTPEAAARGAAEGDAQEGRDRRRVDLRGLEALQAARHEALPRARRVLDEQGHRSARTSSGSARCGRAARTTRRRSPRSRSSSSSSRRRPTRRPSSINTKNRPLARRRSDRQSTSRCASGTSPSRPREKFRADYADSPVAPETWDEQGRANRMKGDDAKAIECFEKAADKMFRAFARHHRRPPVQRRHREGQRGGREVRRRLRQEARASSTGSRT